MSAKYKKNKSSSSLLGLNLMPELTIPEDEKETLAYKVLNAEITKQLCDMEEVDSIQQKLCEFLQLDDVGTDLKQATILDYYVSGFWWAKEQSFTVEQVSSFYTVLSMMLENVRDKTLTMTECMKEFKKLFAGIAVESPELTGGLQCFDSYHAKLIMEYFNFSFFQHYKMYVYLFSQPQDEDIVGTDLIVELPQSADLPWPPPLEEAVPAEVYNTYIEIPPTPEPQEDEREATPDVDKMAAEAEHVADVLSQLSAEEIKQVMNSLFDEMLGGLKSDVQEKLREKENDYINRINKVHRVQSGKSGATSAKTSSR